jgi:hypothetical protein
VVAGLFFVALLERIVVSDDFSSGDIAAAVSTSSAPAASEPSPGSAPPATDTPASATASPAQEPTLVPTTTTDPSAVKAAEPPQERWPDILENARKKEREAIEATWQPYAWAKQVPRESLDRMSSIAQQMTADPAGFLDTYFAELEAHPQHGPIVRSWAAKTLASRRGQQASMDPDVQIVDPQGNVTGATYSADRVKAIVQQAVTDAIGKEVGPIKQDFETRTKQEQAAKLEQARNHKVDAMFSDITEIVGTDAKALQQVHALMAQHPDWSHEKAAWHYHKTVVLPGLSKTERSKVLADIANKPAASTVSPSSGSPANPKADSEKEWTELFREKAAAMGLR